MPDDARSSFPSFGTLAALPVEQRVSILEREVVEMRIRHDSTSTKVTDLHEKMGCQPDAFGKGGTGVLASLDILVRRSELAEDERKRRHAAEEAATRAALEEVRAEATVRRTRPQWLVATLLTLVSVSIGVATFASGHCGTKATTEEMRKP